MKKTFISILGSSVLLGSMTVPAFASTYNFNGDNNGTINITDNSKNYTTNVNITFNDLSGFGWAKNAIQQMAKKGIISGIGGNKFAPAQHITRAQFATLLVREFHLKANNPTQDFVDVPPTLPNGKPNWQFQYVEAAKDYFDAYADLNGGYDFRPNQDVTREDAAVTLVKVLTKAGIIQMDSDAQVQDVLQNYQDLNTVPTSLQPYIATAITNDLMKGDGNGKFAPDRPIRRAEAAVILNKILNQLVVVPGDNSSSQTQTSGQTSDSGTTGSNQTSSTSSTTVTTDNYGNTSGQSSSSTQNTTSNQTNTSDQTDSSNTSVTNGQ
jgi:hypothetical protein